MAGLGEQIHAMASETAKTALAEQKGRLLEEFRLQLREKQLKRCTVLDVGFKADVH